MSLSILVRTLSLTGETKQEGTVRERNSTLRTERTDDLHCVVFCVDVNQNLTALPFKDAFFRTFIAYNWPASGPRIFRTRNTWENRRNVRNKHPRRSHRWKHSVGPLCFLTLPKEPWPRTLSNSNWDGSAFSQPSFTWWVIGISLYVPSSYTNNISMRQQVSHPTRTNTHICSNPIITYTVRERLSLLHGLVHDLMPIDLQPNQQVSSEE